MLSDLRTSNQRLLKSVAGTIQVQFVNQNGEPVAPGGSAITVAATRAAGTAVTLGTPTVGSPTSVYTATISATETSTLDVITAVWSVDGVARMTTRHEIVGAYYFSVSEARTTETGISDVSRFPETRLIEIRREIEEEFEHATGVSFVPRYRSARLPGTGSPALMLTDPFPRSIRSVTVYSESNTASVWSSDDLAKITLSESGLITRIDGTAFDAGYRNIVIEYEHGFDRPPEDVKRAAIQRLRTRAVLASTGIPDRATNMTVSDMGTFQLATAGGRRYTGYPEIDAVLDRYAKFTLGIA